MHPERRIPPTVRHREPSPTLQRAHTVEAVVAHEQALFAEGVDAYGLMVQAGTAAFEVMLERWPSARRIAVLVGPGQNGGDGLVIARLAREAGLSVDLLGWQRPEFTRGAARAWQALREGVPRMEVTVDPESVRAALSRADVVVDALFGIGLSRAIEGSPAHFLRRVAECLGERAKAVPVMAVDAPSGLNCNTAAVDPLTLPADLTVTFLGVKRGQVTGPGVAACGERVLADLGFPIAGATPNSVRLLHGGWSLAPRRPDGHKGTYGTVLVVAGNRGMPGAARLAAEAALRLGAGKVIVATHPDHAATLNVGRPELIVHGVSRGDDLRALLEQSTAVVVGPGLGRDAWSEAMWDGLHQGRLPMVIDADGLGLLEPGALSGREAVITPHPGEAAALLGCRVWEVNDDRYAAARRLADRYGAMVLLKGAGSVVAGESESAVCLRGSPSLATAGSGDVLSGLISALLAMGLPLREAVEGAVALHATAGEIEARARGTWGLAALDLLEPVRDLANGQREPGGVTIRCVSSAGPEVGW
ncbi:MAG: NAD(P)H-hydrate dehydratase [Guyparkeria sp.]|uniref:NAD(P)H-hydrate dehydratase n=1 Tax=Guyparkeria sp. TaxID=2035736 RepID=UPI00397AD134